MILKTLVRFAQTTVISACLFNIGSLPAYAQESRSSVAMQHEISSSAIAREIASHLGSDTEKVRAIFDWITAHIDYDVARLQTGNLIAKSSTETLASRRGLCLDFATLFNEMALSVGVKSEVVFGRIPANDGSADRLNHAWNRVLIGDQFKVVDTTWGSGSVNLENWSFKRKKNTRFLLADPESLRFSHWQADSAGQLVAVEGMSLQAFNETHPNTLHLLNLGFQPRDVLKALSRVNQDQLPRVYLPLDSQIRIKQAPLHMESTASATRFEIQHSAGTTLLLLIGSEYQALTPKNATESVAVLDLNTAGEWSICYRLSDGSYNTLMRYSGSI